jgi:hypothetical protein
MRDDDDDVKRREGRGTWKK